MKQRTGLTRLWRYTEGRRRRLSVVLALAAVSAAGGRSEEKMEMPAMNVTPAERMLLELLLHSAEVREQVFPLLGNFPRLMESAAKEIWEGILTFPDAGSFDWGALEEKLNPSARTLMAAMAFADHLRSEQNMVEQAMACLAELGAGGGAVAAQRGNPSRMSRAISPRSLLNWWSRSARVRSTACGMALA